MSNKRVTIEVNDLCDAEYLYDLQYETTRAHLYAIHIGNREDYSMDVKLSAFRRLIACCENLSNKVDKTKILALQRLKELER